MGFTKRGRQWTVQSPKPIPEVNIDNAQQQTETPSTATATEGAPSAQQNIFTSGAATGTLDVGTYSVD